MKKGKPGTHEGSGSVSGVAGIEKLHTKKTNKKETCKEESEWSGVKAEVWISAESTRRYSGSRLAECPCDRRAMHLQYV